MRALVLLVCLLWPVGLSAQRGPKEMRPPVERDDSGPPRPLAQPAERDDSGKTMVPPVERVAPPPSTITVCASGCAYTNAQLQNALDAAVDGDEVLVQSGFTYVYPGDGYALGKRCAAPHYDCITLRTGVTSAGVVMSLGAFPADGVRVGVLYRGIFAKFRPGENNGAAIRTVYPGETGSSCASQPCRGDGWTLKWLEFEDRIEYPQRALARFGTNKYMADMPNGQGQDTLVEVPRFLSLIQCDLHGDPISGQHVGLLLASGESRVIGNSFRDFKVASADTQAIYEANGLGPHVVENNYLEGAAENVIWGGQDTYLQLRATVTGSPSPTSITLASPVWVHADATTQSANLTTDIYSGIFISVTHAGTEYSGVTCTISGSTCTIAPALPFTPSVGDVVKWCWLAGGITFRYNWSYKPPSWRNPILTTPAGLTATGSSSGGSLAAGTYCYRVQAYIYISGDWYNSIAAAQQCGNVMTGSSGSVTVTWTAVPGAWGYLIYGRASGAPTVNWETPNTTLTITDTGSNSTDTRTPTGASYWVIKNNFELKHAEGITAAGTNLIEFNVFDFSWCCTQDNLISIKTHNQDGGDMSATVRNLIFRNNWIRHGSTAITLVSSDAVNQVSGIMTDVTISNNLFTDLNNTWFFPPSTAAQGAAVHMAGGGNTGIVGSSSCVRCSFIHNTFLVENNDMHGPIWFGLNASDDKYTDFVVRDNIMGRESTEASQVAANFFGVMTDIAYTRQVNGTTSWNLATQGASTASFNAWPESNSTRNSFSTCGGTCGSGFYPSQATLQGYFANYAGCVAGADAASISGCALTGATPLDGAASDATDVGANISAMAAGIAIALSGDMSTPEPPLTPASAHGVRIRLRGGH